MGWRIHVRASENEDGTGDDKFFEMKREFKSLRAAKKAANKYAKQRPPWLREVRVYRSNG